MEEKLKELYYDTKTGYKSAKALYKEAKDRGLKASFSQIKSFLNSQPTYQMNKKPKVKSMFKITAPIGFYQGDLTFYSQYKKVNRGYIGMLCVIEIATRLAYVELIKSKTQEEISTKLEKIIKRVKNKMVSLTTDNGSEFLNSKVTKLLQENNIRHITNQPGDHNTMAVVERFNRTLKHMLNQYFTNRDTYKYYDIIDDIVHNYNNTFHSGIQNIPSKITEEDISKLRSEAIMHNYQQREKNKLETDDSVRLLETKKIFDKEQSRFSSDVYKIKSQVGNSYQIEGKRRTYRPYELLEVPKSSIEEKKQKVKTSKRNEVKKEAKVGRLLKKEGIDTSNILPRRSQRLVKK